MTDRKNVISDLEEQIAWIRDNDFHKFPGWGHAVIAMRDAVTLLKEYAPRVCTIAEIKAIAGNPDWCDDTFCWVEFTDGNEAWIKYLEKDDEWAKRKGTDVAFGRFGGSYALNFSEYNKTWRCWTSRPTSEDSQEVPWDDGQ